MIKGMLLLASIFLMMNVPQAHSGKLENSQSFKATIVENGVEFQWEYDNPNEFEYEHGNTVIKNDEAKRQVKKIFQYLHISPDAKTDNMIKKLKKDGHLNLESIKIKWIDSHEKMYTWVWNKK